MICKNCQRIEEKWILLLIGFIVGFGFFWIMEVSVGFGHFPRCPIT